MFKSQNYFINDFKQVVLHHLSSYSLILTIFVRRRKKHEWQLQYRYRYSKCLSFSIAYQKVVWIIFNQLTRAYLVDLLFSKMCSSGGPGVTIQLKKLPTYSGTYSGEDFSKLKRGRVIRIVTNKIELASIEMCSQVRVFGCCSNSYSHNYNFKNNNNNKIAQYRNDSTSSFSAKKAACTFLHKYYRNSSSSSSSPS